VIRPNISRLIRSVVFKCVFYSAWYYDIIKLFDRNPGETAYCFMFKVGIGDEQVIHGTELQKAKATIIFVSKTVVSHNTWPLHMWLRSHSDIHISKYYIPMPSRKNIDLADCRSHQLLHHHNCYLVHMH